jgi:hypothetical protein
VSDEQPVVHICTDRFGYIDDLKKDAAAFLNLAVRRVSPYNLLNFFLEGRLQLVTDLRAVASVPFPERDAVLRPKERAARRVRVAMREVAHGVLWTVRDLGLAPRKTLTRPG